MAANRITPRRLRERAPGTRRFSFTHSRFAHAPVPSQAPSLRQGASSDRNPLCAVHRPRSHRRNADWCGADGTRHPALAAIHEPVEPSRGAPIGPIAANENPPKENFRTIEGRLTSAIAGAPRGACGPCGNHMRPMCAPNGDNRQMGDHVSSKTSQQSRKTPIEQRALMHAPLA